MGKYTFKHCQCKSAGNLEILANENHREIRKGDLHTAFCLLPKVRESQLHINVFFSPKKNSFAGFH